MEKDKFDLEIPDGVCGAGPYKDVGEAFAKSMAAIPEMLNCMADFLSNISQDLNVICVYFRRRGVQEGHVDFDEFKEVDPKLNDEDENETNTGD